jgi:uncharacterized protein
VRVCFDATVLCGALRKPTGHNFRLLERAADGVLIDGFTTEVAGMDPANHVLSTAPTCRREVDILAEFASGDLIAIEIKATAAPTTSDARHLTWLREVLGERFHAGAVLHTGPRPFLLGDRILALPICTLWG